MTTEKERNWLPDYGADLPTWREWLTKMMGPADGFRIEDFVRHGRQRNDACELVVVAPGGKRLRFEIAEQRFLSTPGSLRATVAGVTDGLVRPGQLSKPELEDVWMALVTLATVTANQDLKSEARDWVEQFEEAAERITGHTLEPPGRVDALSRLVRYHARFERLAALAYADADVPPRDKPRPALLVDSAEVGVRWARVGEFACFLRHVIGTGSMSQPTIDGRLSQLDIARVFFEERALGGKVKADLYRLPAEEEQP